ILNPALDVGIEHHGLTNHGRSLLRLHPRLPEFIRRANLTNTANPERRRAAFRDSPIYREPERSVTG
ncbi:hypothetical protein Cpir12675_006684, partial [Ceratocystis pirilliformis]